VKTDTTDVVARRRSLRLEQLWRDIRELVAQIQAGMSPLAVDKPS
jgi:hypothetical protein